jgi:exopolysaccharide biosynthesis protein
VILRGGKPLPAPHPNDQGSRVRHPRTLVGWNDAGDVWLVTIDGRQRGRSVGATYWEAAAMLQQLGATDGINLDGGGSTTFVARRCTGPSLCVRNRPSDGRERAVTTALAVVPRR